MAKIRVIATQGLFTQACGVSIPVWSVLSVEDNIPAAADYVQKVFKGDAEMVQDAGIIFMEDPTEL